MSHEVPDWPDTSEAGKDIYANCEDNAWWLETLDEKAEDLKGCRIGRRIFYHNHNGTKFIVETHNPYNYEGIEIDEYLSETHYLQVQQHQHELKMLEEQINANRDNTSSIEASLNNIEENTQWLRDLTPISNASQDGFRSLAVELCGIARSLDNVQDRLADLHT